MDLIIKLCLTVTLLQTVAALSLFRSDNSTSRIVGGQNAREGQFPYQILLDFSDGTMCGASLIKVNGKHVVLTAAHCIDADYTPEDISIIAGKLRRSRRSQNEQTRRVTRILCHTGYNDRTHENDICILGIERPFQETDYVKPINLPRNKMSTTGNVLVSGWGHQEEGTDSNSDTLKWVEVPVVSNDKCRQSYGRIITAKNICAGYDEGGKDACQNDSGGPLAKNTGNGAYLAGVVSYGHGCARPNYPGVYSRVSYFIEWIEENAAEA